MPKSIIIPDSHQRIDNIKAILEAERYYDEVIFLGDFFDSFYEPPYVASFEHTCDYLKHLILDHPNKDKFVFLLGNHDISYIYENKDYSNKSLSKTLKYYCSGFTKSKASKFRKHFFDKGLKDEFFFKHFKVAHRTQGWTLSHGGISMEHFPYGYTTERLVDDLLPDVWRNFRNLEYNHNWLISGAGVHRGGNHNVGGVLWLDWRAEFFPSVDIGKQIVGHTVVREPECLYMGKEFESWNLDTEKDYGIIIDGRMTTKKIPNMAGSQKPDTLRWDHSEEIKRYLEL